MKNRDLYRAFLTDDMAANEMIEGGMATFVDGADGRKKTDGAKAANMVRVAEIRANNTTPNKGGAKITTVGSGAIIVVRVKPHGTEPTKPGDYLETAENGRFVRTTTADNYVARFIGKEEECDGVGTELTGIPADSTSPADVPGWVRLL